MLLLAVDGDELGEDSEPDNNLGAIEDSVVVDLK